MPANLWSDDAKIKSWLRVEVAYLQALHDLGKLRVRRDSIFRFERNAKSVTAADVAAFERTSGHDFVAFVERVLVAVDKNAVSRQFHAGLTSSDVEDTALALRMQASLGRAIGALNAKDRRSPSGVRRRAIAALAGAREACSYGKLAGPMGNYSCVSPLVEAKALTALGLKIEPCATQIIPRDRHAEAFLATFRAIALLNPVHALALRPYVGAMLENVPLWHERDISHSSVERIALPKLFEQLERCL